MNDSFIPLGDLVYEMCKRLGISPGDTAEITLLPDEVTVALHVRDEDCGNLLIRDGEVVIETKTFAVTTHVTEEEMGKLARKRAEELELRR